MCGEHWSQCRVCAPVEGSSPHVRGARSAWVIGAVFAGIIPACAGSTSPWPSASARCGDHPRMCGEHGGVNNYNNPTLVSSPHVRGAHAMTGEKTQVYGIIPACAGSTRPNLDCPRLWGDHPRMYGEHDNQQPDAYRPVGSSPHVRGALR